MKLLRTGDSETSRKLLSLPSPQGWRGQRWYFPSPGPGKYHQKMLSKPILWELEPQKGHSDNQRCRLRQEEGEEIPWLLPFPYPSVYLHWPPIGRIQKGISWQGSLRNLPCKCRLPIPCHIVQNRAGNNKEYFWRQTSWGAALGLYLSCLPLYQTFKDIAWHTIEPH